MADYLKLRPTGISQNDEISRPKGSQEIKKQEIPGEGTPDGTKKSNYVETVSENSRQTSKNRV